MINEPKSAGISRRGFLVGAGLGALGVALSACGGSTMVSPTSEAVAVAEKRRNGGSLREFALTAQAGQADLGGLVVPTWLFGDRLAGPGIRATVGDRLRIALTNKLPAPTTVHWHGLMLRNDMDGVPHVTQQLVSPESQFQYEFTAAESGTHWFHPHHGMQLDRGLYAPLIIEDPNEELSYDDEWVLMLDDWIDGTGTNPDEVLAGLQTETGGHEMDHSVAGGSWGGDVTYPHYLINGRVPADPEVKQGVAGQRIRLRIINASADTAYRIWVPAAPMTLTHTDGNPVEHLEVDQLNIGMGERYDAIITVPDGVTAINAVPLGKKGAARALLRSSKGAVPPVVSTAPVSARLANYDQLKAAPAMRLPTREPDQELVATLAGGTEGYKWTINGRAFQESEPFIVSEGERIRLTFDNQSMMWHPMHLHGHRFAVGDSAGAVKDTVAVMAQQKRSVEFDADNPGQWMLHCHNAYHAEGGMMTTLAYQE